MELNTVLQTCMPHSLVEPQFNTSKVQFSEVNPAKIRHTFTLTSYPANCWPSVRNLHKYVRDKMILKNCSKNLLDYGKHHQAKLQWIQLCSSNFQRWNHLILRITPEESYSHTKWYHIAYLLKGSIYPMSRIFLLYELWVVKNLPGGVAFAVPMKYRLRSTRKLEKKSSHQECVLKTLKPIIETKEN